MKFLVSLEQKTGEQKVDVVFAWDQTRPIEQQAIARLQDAIEKLFILSLEFLKEENSKSRPFIDILNRLEQIGWLEDKNAGLELRKTRNRIAHQ